MLHGQYVPEETIVLTFELCVLFIHSTLLLHPCMDLYSTKQGQAKNLWPTIHMYQFGWCGPPELCDLVLSWQWLDLFYVCLVSLYFVSVTHGY